MKGIITTSASKVNGGCVCLWKLGIFIIWCWLNIRPASRLQQGVNANLRFNNTILCCIYRTAVVSNWIELRSVGRCNVFFFQQCLTFRELDAELCKQRSLLLLLWVVRVVHTQSWALHRELCTHGAERRAGTCAHTELSTTQGWLAEIKADSRGNKLLLLLATATDMTEQNKQANEVPTLCFMGLCSASYSFGSGEFSWELGPKPQVFLYIVVLHKC